MKKLYIILGSILFIVLITGFIVSFLANKEVKHPMVMGEAAPAMITNDIEGNPFDLDSMSSNQMVYLSFLRFAGCPVCNYRVHELMDEKENLETLGIKTILVYESTEEMMKKYVKESSIPFTIISDKKGEFYDLFKVEDNLFKTMKAITIEEAKRRLAEGTKLYQGDPYENDGSFSRIPADFLIYKGKIIAAQYGRNVADHMPIADLKSIVSKRR